MAEIGSKMTEILREGTNFGKITVIREGQALAQGTNFFFKCIY